ncbi:hypothetical protein [Chlorobium ferrooxidans]|nr:hypothetical protein [Chlorobium ferrooxidans]
MSLLYAREMSLFPLLKMRDELKGKHLTAELFFLKSNAFSQELSMG